MAAVGEEVGLGRHPGVVQGGEHLQAVLHGDAVVLHGVPQKGRAGVLGDVLVQGEILVAGGAGLAAADVAQGHHVGMLVRGDDRVAQNHGVGPVLAAVVVIVPQKFLIVPQGAQRGRQVPTGGEPAHGHALRVHPVVRRLLPDEPEGFGELFQGLEILCLLPGGVDQREHLVSPGEEP